METATQNQRYLAFAKVRCQKYGTGTQATMVLKNISSKGARLNIVSAGAQFSKGDVLRLFIELEKVNSLRTVNAEVVWAQGNALGVCFVAPEDVVAKLFKRP